jgi:hypothetical protein
VRPRDARVAAHLRRCRRYGERVGGKDLVQEAEPRSHLIRHTPSVASSEEAAFLPLSLWRARNPPRETPPEKWVLEYIHAGACTMQRPGTAVPPRDRPPRQSRTASEGPDCRCRAVRLFGSRPVPRRQARVLRLAVEVHHGSRRGRARQGRSQVVRPFAYALLPADSLTGRPTRRGSHPARARRPRWLFYPATSRTATARYAGAVGHSCCLPQHLKREGVVQTTVTTLPHPCGGDRLTSGSIS